MPVVWSSWSWASSSSSNVSRKSASFAASVCCTFRSSCCANTASSALFCASYAAFTAFVSGVGSVSHVEGGEGEFCGPRADLAVLLGNLLLSEIRPCRLCCGEAVNIICFGGELLGPRLRRLDRAAIEVVLELRRGRHAEADGGRTCGRGLSAPRSPSAGALLLRQCSYKYARK